MAGESPFAATYQAVAMCANGLGGYLHLSQQEPTPKVRATFRDLYRRQETACKALGATLGHTLPELANVTKRKVTVCGVKGACWSDAILQLACKTQSQLLMLSPLIETDGGDIPTEKWGDVRQVVAHLKDADLIDAQTEARLENALAEAQGRITTGGNGTTNTANLEGKGNCVTGGKGDGSTGGGGGAVELSGEAKALALLVQHPDWTNEQIANAVNCHPRTLYKWEKYVEARKRFKEANKQELPHGSKYKDEGVEAWDEERDEE